ncbi:NAD-dependent epimerase/dehydratase family protein [Vibrio metschnikovii]|uniref:NAD-dependent epimerase/dehydratase family protein n=1 Tax=Vibrio metschnikovii TaxID=28172 RepID=UPI001C302896|nr:NAD-dependent epimerase/dehydratase family protein [Vibrio metschnikovii]
MILGGTGAIGSHLISELKDKNYHLDITTRQSKVSTNNNINFILGNAKDTTFFYSLINSKKYDCIIDLMLYNTGEFKERYENILLNCKHYIFVSTYRVFSNVENSLIDENSPRLLDNIEDSEYLKTDDYALTKARQEDILIKSDMNNWTIVRPSITYSRNRFQLGVFERDIILSRANMGLEVPMPKEILDKYTTMTWAGDVAKMIEKLILNKDAYAESFNTVSHEYKTWRQVAKYYEDNIGITVKVVNEDQFMPLVTSFWQYKYDRTLNRCCDNNKILKITGLSKDNIMKLEDGLKLELSNYRSDIEFPARFNGRIDRVLKITNLNFNCTLKNTVKYFVGRVKIIDFLFIKLGF